MRKLLFVIDYIEGIAITGSCASYLAAHPELIENTNALIKKFRASNLPVFFIRLAFDDTYAGLPPYAPNAKAIKENKKFLIDHPDTQFIAELNFKEGEHFVFNKKFGAATFWKLSKNWESMKS
jgi:nicotinamidase-related amidase